MGHVCPDDEKHGHQHHEPAVGASPGGQRSTLPTFRLSSRAQTTTLMARTGVHLGNGGLLASIMTEVQRRAISALRQRFTLPPSDEIEVQI